MTKLTSEQVSELLLVHCHRVIDNMDADDLKSYAIQLMAKSFYLNPGQGGTDIDVDMLIKDIWIEEEDEDSMQEFIAGIVGNELADEIMKTPQF